MDPREVANPTYELLSRVFFDADAARELLEAMRWPDGPVCPHCGAAGGYKLTAKPGSKRPVRAGVYKCKAKACKRQYTVTVGTVFAESHVGLDKWMYAIHLMCAAKKGISARQLERTLGVQYKTAWFMCHRIRKAMEAEPLAGLLSGIVEADETYVGGKARRGGPPGGKPKTVVFAMVERKGRARSQVVADVTAETLQSVLVEELDPATRVMTDGLQSYRGLAAHFAEHSAIDHDKEYVRGVVHTNTVESLFSLLKRGIMGTYHRLSRKHLGRYVGEFDFRWNHRDIEDGQRMVAAVVAAKGKRLYYRPPKGGGGHAAG